MTPQEIENFIEEEFRWFHAHPELSYQEFETTARLKRIFSQRGLSVLDLPLETGLVAEVGSGKPPLIALRCDIDALPIEEKTGLSYASLEKGKMHACGHDFHTASILGAALLLKECEEDLAGTVRLIFQPAEEAPGGAKKVLATGALENAAVIFGIHTSPLFDVGTVALRAEAVMAAVDRFQITFHGRGTHAAHPDRGVDTIVLAAGFVSAAQTIVSRNADPFSPALVSITRMEAGNTWNVLPETSFLEGTTRSLSPEDRRLLRERLCTLAEKYAEGYGARAEIEWYEGPPATINDREWTEFAEGQAKGEGFQVLPAVRSLGGEDFAFYQEKIPGVFISIGTGKSPANHSPNFIADPAALFPAAKYTARLAKEAAKRLAKGEMG